MSTDFDITAPSTGRDGDLFVTTASPTIATAKGGIAPPSAIRTPDVDGLAVVVTTPFATLIASQDWLLSFAPLLLVIIMVEAEELVKGLVCKCENPASCKVSMIVDLVTGLAFSTTEARDEESSGFNITLPAFFELLMHEHLLVGYADSHAKPE